MRIKKMELSAAGAFIMISIYSIQQGMKKEFMIRGIPGPGFLPVIIGGAILILSFILLVQAVRNSESNSDAKKIINPKMAATVLGLALYIILMKPLGYILSTFIFCLIQFHFWGAFKWYKTLTISLVSALAMYFVFIYWIGIPLRAGLGL